MKSKSYCGSGKILAATVFLLLFTASCMKDKPDSLPENLVWNPELAIPLGYEQFGLNSESGFDTTLFGPDTITGLPLWAKESELIMETVLDFDLAIIRDNLEYLNRILFRINSYNQFPHTVHSQGYFQDAAMNIIDSMFLEGPMETPPGLVSTDGASIVVGYARHDATFDLARIQPLGDAQTLSFRTIITLEDLDSTLVPLYPDFRFDLDIGMMLDLSLSY